MKSRNRTECSDIGACSVIQVGVAPTLIAVPSINRLDISILNKSGVSILIGLSAAEINIPVANGEALGFDSYLGAIYATVAADTADVNVIEVG